MKNCVPLKDVNNRVDTINIALREIAFACADNANVVRKAISAMSAAEGLRDDAEQMYTVSDVNNIIEGIICYLNGTAPADFVVCKLREDGVSDDILVPLECSKLFEERIDEKDGSLHTLRGALRDITEDEDEHYKTE